MSKLITGVHAAVGVPRHPDGRLDEVSFRKHIEFLMTRGIRGVALNGATGEYCLTTHEELSRLLAVTRDASGGRLDVICGIGAAGIHDCVKSGMLAAEGGSRALLLPMPYFFPYDQDDLSAFCREAARQLRAPILLYNLPRFTTGLTQETVFELIGECENIIGIKDSSGSLDILQALTKAGLDACRMVGNDTVAAEARQAQVCDGVISGVAGVLPELILGLFESDPASADFARSAQRLQEFVEQVDGLPTPWGLKWIGECRGMGPASFSQPVSPRRQEQGRALQKWFEGWWKASGPPGIPRN
jgi:4-hydroxy-tetrahydrodipicolinate synthase